MFDHSCTVRFGEVSQVLASAAVSKERHREQYRGLRFCENSERRLPPERRAGFRRGGVVFIPLYLRHRSSILISVCLFLAFAFNTPVSWFPNGCQNMWGERSHSVWGWEKQHRV